MDKVCDNFNRPIISLRISITNRCNINCFYCHHDGMLDTLDEMTVDEIFKIAKIAKSLGVERIRLSGGEPLVRKDIADIVKSINSLGFRDISITTNGIFLGELCRDLIDAGLNRVNVSLDTLNPLTYKKLTGFNYIDKVKKSIIKASNSGLNPVKINMVLMKGVNDNEVWDMFDFCKNNNLILQLIEIMDAETVDNFNENYHYDMNLIEEELKIKADKIEVRNLMQDRKKYFIDNGEIELVRPLDNTAFCNNCTRLRVTPEGKIKPCLLRNDNLVDIVSHIRNGESDEFLRSVFLEAIANREPFYHV